MGLLTLLLAFAPLLADAAVRPVTLPPTLRTNPPSFRALPDAVYLQELRRPTGSLAGLEAVGLWNESAYISTHGTSVLAEVQSDGVHLKMVPLVPPPSIRRMVRTRDALWAMGPSGLYRLDQQPWRKISGEPIVDLTEHRGEILAITPRQLWRLRGEALEPASPPEARFDLTHVLSHQDAIYLHGSGRLSVFAQGVFGARDVYDGRTDRGWDWGNLPSSITRDAKVLGPALYLATDRGLAVHRGMSMTSITGREGLPIEDTTCLAEGFEGDLWIGTRQGLIRKTAGGDFHYFAGQRWLPDDRVNAIAVAGHSVYAATEGGLAILDYLPFTLSRKAAWYEQELEAWGQKRLGLVQKLEWDPPLKEFVREAGDNDGGYTGYYLAAQSYRWAVTQDPVARREATNTFHALCWLQDATGIPGFPARSIWAKGEVGHKSTGGSGGYPAEWHDTKDGLFEWKGDTSSDELCSHFYAFSLFLELAAEGEEVAQAKRHLARIATHLIEHQWQLIDLDGKPTRWGRWDPEYFQTDEGKYDRGLQCLELLSFIKTAEVLTGDPKFAEAYRRLVDLGYPQHTLRERNTFPPEDVLHFLDELAFWSYWNLIRYEQDPELRSLYRRSLERTYEVIRVERQPWFNFVYSVLTGNQSETEASLAHLREWPLDLRTWSYRNSHRADLRTPPGYIAPKGGTRAFSPRETEPMRWDHWTMQADGGSGGNDVVEPASWLLAYWMGRYHGLITPPAIPDAAFSEGPSLPHPTARPYTGPPRPQ